MDLSVYLKNEQVSLAEMARKCQTSSSTVLRMRDRIAVPSRRVAVALWDATNGSVTPNDLYDLHYPEGKCRCSLSVSISAGEPIKPKI